MSLRFKVMQEIICEAEDLLRGAVTDNVEPSEWNKEKRKWIRKLNKWKKTGMDSAPVHVNIFERGKKK